MGEGSVASPDELPAFVVLRHHVAPRRHSPECFVDRSRIIAIEIRKVCLHSTRCLDGVVMRDLSIHVMRDVRAADVMMQEIEYGAYGRSTVMNAPLTHVHSSSSKCGTSTSVCWSHVYKTSQKFTTK